MKIISNAAINKGTKKPYTKPELQVYGNLAEITNASTHAGIHGDVVGNTFHGARTH
jgi:hypothetical protein